MSADSVLEKDVRSQSLREREGDAYGGSAEGIREHYDIGNEFWPLVLGPTMTYSSALFSDPDEPLDVAQRRKIEWHIGHAGVRHGASVLDVGCGWGSVLTVLASMPSVKRSVGLTLSTAQHQYLEKMKLAHTEVRIENWATYEPVTPFDSIISVGALEHFTKREETPEEKVAVYRDFFQRCRRWLTPTGRMSLQTIAFGNMRREDASAFMNENIFPDSDLPTRDQVLAAAEGLFELVAFRNDRLHYARTYDLWATNLRCNRARAIELVGEGKVTQMERYFKLTSMGFRMGKQHLLRFALRPLRDSWAATGANRWDADRGWTSAS